MAGIADQADPLERLPVLVNTVVMTLSLKTSISAESITAHSDR